MKSAESVLAAPSSAAVSQGEIMKIEVKDRFLRLSMRSVGYNNYTAIMELIDNSIDAGATCINIDYDGDKLVIRDDGSGMSYDKLKASMMVGYDRAYGESEIGYFGVGMKSAIINLSDPNKDSSPVKIKTFDGEETTVASWDPNKEISKFLVDREPTKSTAKKGTTITINNAGKIQLATLKKKLGMVFYPTLSIGRLKLIVNDLRKEEKSTIRPTDPLYRDSSKTATNVLEATVAGHKIELIGALVDEYETPHHGEAKAEGSHKWPYRESGCYVIYGGRYIETGGLLGIVGPDPWQTRTRIEFAIPKELTHIFGIKFNKTKGLELSSQSNEATSDLALKVKDLFAWSKKLRQKNKETLVTADEKSDLQAIQDEVNDSARKARLGKPELEKGPKNTKKKLPPVKGPDDGGPDDGGGEVKLPVKGKVESRIIKEELFEIHPANLDSSAVFWNMMWNNKKFIITLNENHIFYKNIFRDMNPSAKRGVMMWLAAMAHAQYESMKLEEVNETNLEMFWETFWGDASMKLSHMYLA